MGKRRPPWFAVAACLVVFALYWPSVHLAPSALDDQTQLQALSEAPFSRVFELDPFGHLRPLKSALFWLLSRSMPWLELWRGGLLAVVLLAGLVGQSVCAPLLASPRWAWLCTLCWLLNPITFTTLCWLSSAHLALCGLALLSYLALAQRSVRADATPLSAALAIASLCAAILSHELALLAPLLWFAYRQSLGRPAADRRRLRVLTAASLLCVVGWLGWYATRDGPTSAYRFADHQRWQLWLSAPRYLLENLRLWVWLPDRFGVLLPDEPSEHLLTSVLAWSGIIAGCAWLWRRRDGDPTLHFGLAWSACLLVPLTNFVPLGNTPVAMHYLYLPGWGLALLVTRAVQRLGARLRRAEWPAAALLPPLALGLLLVAWLAQRDTSLAAWGNATQLYQTTIENYPSNIEARVNLTAAYLDEKRYAEAEPLLVASLRLAPNELGLLANQFKLLAETGKTVEALAWQQAHAALNVPALLGVRAELLTRVGRHHEATLARAEAFAAARSSDARCAAGHQLTMALVREQRYAEARMLLERLLAEFPDRPELLFSKRLLAEPPLRSPGPGR